MQNMNVQMWDETTQTMRNVGKFDAVQVNPASIDAVPDGGAWSVRVCYAAPAESPYIWVTPDGEEWTNVYIIGVDA